MLTCGMVKLHASPLHDCWFEDPSKKLVQVQTRPMTPLVHFAPYMWHFPNWIGQIKPRLTWRPHRTASPRRSSAAPGVLAPGSECLPEEEAMDALGENWKSYLFKACCQCVIQSVMCLDVMIANLICTRHVVIQGVNEASQDDLKFTQLL